MRPQQWLTPGDYPSDIACTAVYLPTDPMWRRFVFAQLWELADPEHWHQEDGLSAEDTASVWYQLMEDFVTPAICE